MSKPKAKKYTLEIEFDIDFELIGISSHIKDYKLSWKLNEELEWKLERKEDLLIKSSKGVDILLKQFYYQDIVFNSEHFLINNKSENGYFLPELKMADYILISRYSENKEHYEKLVVNLRAISHVLTAFNINTNTIVNKHHLSHFL